MYINQPSQTLWKQLKGLLFRADKECLKPHEIKEFFAYLGRFSNRPDPCVWIPYILSEQANHNSISRLSTDEQAAVWRLLQVVGIHTFHQVANQYIDVLDETNIPFKEPITVGQLRAQRMLDLQILDLCV